MADSGKILATDKPLPVQNARRPPSAYIRAMAPAIALAPCRLGFGDKGVPPRSGGRVIKNIFSRSKGAVQVRDTEIFKKFKLCLIGIHYSPAPAIPPAVRNLMAACPSSQL